MYMRLKKTTTKPESTGKERSDKRRRGFPRLQNTYIFRVIVRTNGHPNPIAKAVFNRAHKLRKQSSRSGKAKRMQIDETRMPQ